MGNAENPERHPGLESRKEALEKEIRQRFSGSDRTFLKKLPVMQSYEAYYKRFGKSYHVQLQVESVAFKGKGIPRVAALVEAMFMAELKNMLLTAGHDLSYIQGSVALDAAAGTESFTMLNGKEQILKAGDMMMSDGQGVISSVLYGPDHRTRIRSDTGSVLFAVYAPQGIPTDTVREHLKDIRSNVLLVSPGAETELIGVYP